jgi:hypothetical protein
MCIAWALPVPVAARGAVPPDDPIHVSNVHKIGGRRLVFGRFLDHFP